VRVKLARRSEQIPGVPGRPEAPLRVQYREVSLTRERVQLSPVYHTALQALRGGGGVGYIRLASFSSNAAGDVEAAIRDLQVAAGGGVRGACCPRWAASWLRGAQQACGPLLAAWPASPPAAGPPAGSRCSTPPPEQPPGPAGQRGAGAGAPTLGTHTPRPWPWARPASNRPNPLAPRPRPRPIAPARPST
jgi:hypothetical protein